MQDPLLWFHFKLLLAAVQLGIQLLSIFAIIVQCVCVCVCSKYWGLSDCSGKYRKDTGPPQIFGFYTMRDEAGCQIYSFIEAGEDSVKAHTHSYTQQGGGTQMAMQVENKTRQRRTRQGHEDQLSKHGNYTIIKKQRRIRWELNDTTCQNFICSSVNNYLMLPVAKVIHCPCLSMEITEK